MLQLASGNATEGVPYSRTPPPKRERRSSHRRRNAPSGEGSVVTGVSRLIDSGFSSRIAGRLFGMVH